MKLSHGDGAANYPDFLVVGAAKSGTSSLHRYLARQPDIVLPPTKETWFWHQNRNANRAIFNYWDESRIPASLEEYLGLFDHAEPGQLVGEVCPSYLYYHEQTIESLKEFHPRWREVKIIIILRDPTDRILSEYRFVRQHGLDPEQLGLDDALRREESRKHNPDLLLDLHYRSLSRYCSQVAAYLDAFPNVHVCLFDDLLTDSDALMQQLLEFLGAETVLVQNAREQVNRSHAVMQARSGAAANFYQASERLGQLLPEPVRRFAGRMLRGALFEEETMDDTLVQSLRKEFLPEIAGLEALIGRDLARWKI